MPDKKNLVLGLMVAIPAWAGAAEPLGRSPEDAARVAEVTRPATGFDAPEPFESHPGGAGTVAARGDARALSQPAANLDPARGLDFELGRSLFEKLWVASPSSTRASDGLGPLYNARSCGRCHIRDGRGHPPSPAGGSAESLVLRLSVPGGAAPDGIAEWIATQGDPVYGGQLQDVATPGHRAEGRIALRHEETAVTLAGGEVVHLRRPDYRIADPAYGPLADGLMTSARVAPPMTGLALLAAIPEADILAQEDPEDADGDGISGRAGWQPGPQGPQLGRFGWKAGVATLEAQVAQAFVTDLGLSTPLHPVHAGDCTPAQTACRAAPDGADPERAGLEVDGAAFDLVTFYAGHLGVPARRDLGAPAVLRGKAVFHAAGCPACHVPKFVTARDPARPATSFQLIWPWSDLLLHDMGEGLADHRPEGRATGREWRTPPLWGVGLAQAVSPEAGFLHDGRARSLIEAVLWHGGEAAPARDRVIALPKPDRDALIAFLESL